MMEIAKDQVDDLRASNEFVFVSEVGLPKFRNRKIVPALLIVAGVVSTAALGLVDIVVGAITGSVLLVVFRCITMEEAYRAIDWKVIFLLAGTLSLGLALEKTGTAASATARARAAAAVGASATARENRAASRRGQAATGRHRRARARAQGSAWASVSRKQPRRRRASQPE